MVLRTWRKTVGKTSVFEPWPAHKEAAAGNEATVYLSTLFSHPLIKLKKPESKSAPHYSATSTSFRKEKDRADVKGKWKITITVSE